MKLFQIISRIGFAIFVGLHFAAHSVPVSAQGAVLMEFVEQDSGAPISARVVFTKSAKRLSRPKKILFASEQWLAEQNMPLSPPVGEYEFMVIRGPEFKEIRGGFTIEPKAKDTVLVEVPRAVNMHEEHWYSGDHLSNLAAKDLKRWQLADAVDFAVTVDTSAIDAPPANQRTGKARKPDIDEPQVAESEIVGLKLTSVCQSLDWKQGMVLVHRPDPLQIQQNVKQKDAPEDAPKAKPGMGFGEAIEILRTAKNDSGTVAELLQPWSRDVPILLGNEAIRSVQILSTYNRPKGDDRIMVEKSNGSKLLQAKIAWSRGKERLTSLLFAPIDSADELKYKSPRGVGLLSEAIYWKMLEAGLRLTPTAGSDFANNDTNLGYNRVYIHSEEEPTVSTWWQSILRGCTMVTNGPLLRVSINGQAPGSVQASYRGQSIPLDIAASLAVREPVDYLDVVFNGETIYSAKLEDHYKRGEFPPLEISESGWVVVRVVTAYDKGYRLATTAPFYFEFDGKPRVSRTAVEFFKKWLEIAKKDIEDNNQSDEYRSAIEQAEQFWESR